MSLKLPNPAADIATSNTDITLPENSNRYIAFSSFTASRNITLPTTSVRAGELFTLENTTQFDMVVKSSNGVALTVANGSNSDATVYRGYVKLRALQDAPTTPAHWRIVEVYEYYVNSTSITNTSASPVSRDYAVVRFNRTVTISQKSAITTFTKANTSNPVWATAIPSRFRPVATVRFGNQDRNNAVDEIGSYEINTSGTMFFYRPAEAAWTAAVNTIETYGVGCTYYVD